MQSFLEQARAGLIAGCGGFLVLTARPRLYATFLLAACLVIAAPGPDS